MRLGEKVRVRFATPDDLDWLTADEAETDPKLQRAYRLSVELGRTVVAELEGGLIGCLRFDYFWDRVPCITVAYVTPREYQGQGVGRAMLGFVEDFLRGQGYRQLMSSSDTDAARSQAWHRKMGFKESGLLVGLDPRGTGELFFLKDL